MSEMQIPVWNGPSPKPRDASTPARRLIDLANLVPAGEWVSFGDLAEAYVVRNGANMVARGVASALSLRPADVFIEDRAPCWTMAFGPSQSERRNNWWPATTVESIIAWTQAATGDSGRSLAGAALSRSHRSDVFSRSDLDYRIAITSLRSSLLQSYWLKVGCWGVAFDLLQQSRQLRFYVEEGKAILGVNHQMADFATGRKKDLDLVIARPAGPVAPKPETFAGLADRCGIELTDDERGELAGLPEFLIAPVGAALVALEAKACMTAHVRSLPRLCDELSSSYRCVHGASRQALAIGYVHVNAAERFVSSVANNYPLADYPVRYTDHREPEDTRRVIAKVSEIPRRSASSEIGFDGLGTTVLDLANDGSPVNVVSTPPAPQPGDPFHYDSMIVRMANEYDTVFSGI